MCLWDAEDLEPLKEMRCGDDVLWGGFSSNGGILFARTKRGVHLWDRDGNDLGRVTATGILRLGVQISPNGLFAVLTRRDGTAALMPASRKALPNFARNRAKKTLFEEDLNKYGALLGK